MPIIHRPVLVFPEHEVTLDEVLEYLERAYAHTPNLDRALRAVKACEVKTRRYCRPLADLAPTTLGQRMRWHFSDACDFGEAAARQALTAAELDATDVDMLIAVSSAGYRMPGLDIALIERLNLVHTVRRMPVLHLGCAGAPYALNHAVEQASLYPGHITLLVFADMFIPFLHPDDTELDSMIFRGLMGDGAAACVVRGGDADHGPSICDTWTCTCPAPPTSSDTDSTTTVSTGSTRRDCSTSSKRSCPGWPNGLAIHQSSSSLIPAVRASCSCLPPDFPTAQPCWTRHARASPNTATWDHRLRWTSSPAPSTTHLRSVAAACWSASDPA